MNLAHLPKLNWLLLLYASLLTTVGLIMLYSAAAENISPWAIKQFIRFLFGLGLAIIIALIDIKLWLRLAWWIYWGSLALLATVPFLGTVGSGARRWLDLGVFNLQPSEVVKVTTVIALARYFHILEPEKLRNPLHLLWPLVVIFLPAVMVLQQPDLGTALAICFGGVAVLFLAGVAVWMFAVALALGILAVPIVWRAMEDYQQSRVLTFLNPEGDPLGSGYHITQSKIALGSGGLFGQGLFQGTQSHLNFLPEKHTDFIFAMLSEELGLVGAAGILLLYFLIFISAFNAALKCREQFGRILAMGLAFVIFLYVAVNTAMVMSLIPVVGVPLPPISYGGTSLLTFMIAIGFIMNVHLYRESWVGRTGFTE